MPPPTTMTIPPSTAALPAPTTTTIATTTTSPAEQNLGRPDWLGSRPLPLGPDGYALPQPTPPELVDRRFSSIDVLPPPAGADFEWAVAPVPEDVAARSTWQPECPVTLEDLRYVTVSFWGFDERAHTGELIVNATVADDIVEVFRRLWESRFPIEEMRVVRAEELDFPPTGDGNNTTAFVCRPIRGGATWSQHAYGLAVDVNPFHNPYLKGDRVLPELATAYLDRTDVRPGMVFAGDPVGTAFADIGWAWGGDFRTLADYMHFSSTGR